MSASVHRPGCPLCDSAGGRLVFQGRRLRVIHADEAGFPAFYRVVWNDHVAEWSDLSADERALCMEAVAVVERCLRDALAPTKINLAALGNMVAHLHWHVIARFEWDNRFPSPVWAAEQRAGDPQREQAVAFGLPALEREMIRHLATGGF
ncbi:HIT family protein [Variovorax sp. J22P168]|uniref:HIT family protein n=1 Tax=Variovorax jilinensis TaxID=3053513 RepID=UPI0025765A6C|nr:HIT family protein [Variovorax sp. J22P168]MDM0011479.1 HIT family protein [Variovorax sp. J22P168]